MYVADASDGKVYTYNMPDAIDARLAALTLSGRRHRRVLAPAARRTWARRRRA